MMRYQMEYMMHYQDTDGFQVFIAKRGKYHFVKECRPGKQMLQGKVHKMREENSPCHRVTYHASRYNEEESQ